MKPSMILLLVAPLACSGYLFRFPKASDLQANPFIFEDIINNTVQGIINGLEDPLLVDDSRVEIPPILESILMGFFEVTNFIAAGQKSLQLPNLVFLVLDSGFSLNASISLPQLQITSNYDLHLSIPLIDVLRVTGTGDFNLNLVDFRVNLHSRLNIYTLNGSEVSQLSSTRILINFAASTSLRISDLKLADVDLGQGLNLFISVILGQIRRNPEGFADIISPVVESAINGILNPAGLPTEPPINSATTPSGQDSTPSGVPTEDPTTTPKPNSAPTTLPSVFILLISLLRFYK